MSTVWSRPVLASVVPVIQASSHVATSDEAIAAVAGWMAYEDFGNIGDEGPGPFDFGPDVGTIMDAALVAGSLDFAFTEFDTGIKYETTYDGRSWSDADAMFAGIHGAVRRGIPVLDGAYLAGVTRSDLEEVFRGSIEMPMLDERVVILNDIGAVLVDRYHGHFHEFIAACPPRLYAGGDGVLERLIAEFPRFDDVHLHGGRTVRIDKLAQLSLWALHRVLHPTGAWSLADLADMTAFADYIVPVALRVMGILEYSEALEARIGAGEMIARDSDEEVEIRAHTLYATARLTDEINRRRPSGMELVIPQIDYRLWRVYHKTFWPHHRTRTIMY